jgi:hypothetical protein
MLGLLLGLVMAQEATISSVPTSINTLINQYTQDYQYQLSQYQTKYLDYLNKKDVYTRYLTITSEKDKIESTKTVLIARNTLLRSYLLALRIRLDEFKSKDPTETEKIQIELSKWEGWLDEQNLVIGNFNNQSDIKIWSQTFTDKYIPLQTIAYTALVQNQVNQRLLILEKIIALGEKLKKDPNLGDKLTSYLSNLPIKSDLALDGLSKAQKATSIKQLGNRFTNFYADAKVEINRTDAYLQNMISDLRAVAIKLYLKL